MKIQIRKNIFETNSSSTHCLIITNEKNKENDIKKIIEKEKFFFLDSSSFQINLTTKKDKILMMAGLFDNENYQNNLIDEYNTFIKVLKDHNEIELLKQIEKNRKDFLNDPDEPYCTNYYYDGCLIECNCKFCHLFNQFFKTKESTKEELYQKITKFIYEDGIIIPYETI